jgi:hypothetical protein
MLHQLDVLEGRQGIEAINHGRDLFEALGNADSGVTTALPGLKARASSTINKPTAYLVQEYLHENWHPLWHSIVAHEMAAAKLSFVASATFSENLLPGILPKSKRAVLESYRNPAFREDLSDCLINQAFRRDIFCRGPRKRWRGANDWQRRVKLYRPDARRVPQKIEVAAAYGKVTLEAKNFAPLLGSVGHAGASLSDVLDSENRGGADTNRANLQRVVLLLHSGWLALGSVDYGSTEAAVQFNENTANCLARGSPYRHLASAVTGSGIGVTETELVLLKIYAERSGKLTADDGEQLVGELQQIGRSIARKGKALQGEEAVAEGRRVTQNFQDVIVPVWKNLGIIA